MPRFNYYFSKNKLTLVPLNRWDLMGLTLVLTAIVTIGIAATQMTKPYQVGQIIPISLSPYNLPFYAIRSVVRIFSALFLSLAFTFIFGTWAAKSRRAGQILIPAIDILQSVPVLGFLSIATVGFIELFHGSLLGPEFAAIFVIFTAQAWNMALSFYQSLRSIPYDLIEAADMLQLAPWQRFWRIEVPFAMPSLLWNTMVSMSASWFFVVASEAITVANLHIMLPGIGSYIAVAIQQANPRAVIYAIVAMFVVILLYDQMLFRPLMNWAEKFKTEAIPRETTSRTWVMLLLQRTYALKYFGKLFSIFSDRFINFSLFLRKKKICVPIAILFEFNF